MVCLMLCGMRCKVFNCVAFEVVVKMVFTNVCEVLMCLKLLRFSRHYFGNWFWAYLRKGLIRFDMLTVVYRDGAKLVIHMLDH